MSYENDNITEIEYEQEVVEEGAIDIVPSEPETPAPKRKKRKKKRYFLKFCIMVLVCVAAYFIMHSPIFEVEKIVLAENDHMTKQQVKEITGYKKGINLFEIDARQNQKKLEKDSYIKEADISRKLPGTIKITLTLREKTAVLESKKGYVLVDNEDIVIDILEQPPQYTVLAGITVKNPEKGEAVEVKETEKYEQYTELLKEISEADMYFKRLEIDKKNVKAYATDTLVCVGTLDNFVKSMKEGNLQAIFYDLMQKGIKSGTVKIGEDHYYSYSK